MKIQILYLVSIASLASPVVSASNESGWFLRPYIALSQLSDFNGTAQGIGNLDGSTQVKLDSGFAAGFGGGYRFNPSFSAELAWEYRTNDSQVILPDGTAINGGNYASNTFFLNGSYHFETSSQWRPYIGLGLSWVQEVDIDLEAAGNEFSYSGDGQTGYQAFAGVEYLLNESWSWHGELRYGDVGDIALQGEEGAFGRFEQFEYTPATLQFGFKYLF